MTSKRPYFLRCAATVALSVAFAAVPERAAAMFNFCWFTKRHVEAKVEPPPPIPVPEKTFENRAAYNEYYLRRHRYDGGPESVGGNAGNNKFAINVLVDINTRTIEFVGNTQQYPQAIRRAMRAGKLIHVSIAIELNTVSLQTRAVGAFIELLTVPDEVIGRQIAEEILVTAQRIEIW